MGESFCHLRTVPTFELTVMILMFIYSMSQFHVFWSSVFRKVMRQHNVRCEEIITEIFFL